MKQLHAFLLSLFLIAFATSCNKDGDNDWTPPRSGDYFTCLVNGERFETEGSFNCSSKTFYYYPEGSVGLDDSYLLASGRNCETSKAVGLRFSGLSPTTGYFDFNDTLLADSSFPIYAQALTFYDRLQSGYIEITEFSPRDGGQGEFGTFEGTFEFTVKHDTIDTVINITEGQFRFSVPNIW
jgi:hypothetical protein